MTLYLNPFNALVSLVLPTALIMVVDLVSFALPLDGERNAFKIKLVFSFAMFLLILSKQLPEGGPCSPLICKWKSTGHSMCLHTSEVVCCKSLKNIEITSSI